MARCHLSSSVRSIISMCRSMRSSRSLRLCIISSRSSRLTLFNICWRNSATSDTRVIWFARSVEISFCWVSFQTAVPTAVGAEIPVRSRSTQVGTLSATPLTFMPHQRAACHHQPRMDSQTSSMTAATPNIAQTTMAMMSNQNDFRYSRFTEGLGLQTNLGLARQRAGREGPL
jgi:hypothetical protein